jgi:hypothetical protein
MARNSSTVGGIGVGYQAGRNNVGDYNVYLGYQSGYGLSSGAYSNGNNNIGIGFKSLYAVETAQGNVAIGASAGNSITTGINNIILGDSADATSATTSNEITLGNANINRFRVPGVKITVHSTAVGINTDDASRANLADPVGAGHSLVGLYIGDGSLLFNNTLNRVGGYYISTETNALNAGPVTLDANMKVDGAWVIV